MKITQMLGLLIVGLFVFGISTSFAAKIYVPQDYPSIQEAVNAANDGDVILVSVGVYQESIRIEGPRPGEEFTLSLIGLDKVIVEGDIVVHIFGSGPPVKDNILIQNIELLSTKSGSGVGINAVGSRLTIRHCTITGYDRGVFAQLGSAYVNVIGSQIIGCNYGIRTYDGTQTINLERSRLAKNFMAVKLVSPGSQDEDTLIATNNTFLDNDVAINMDPGGVQPEYHDTFSLYYSHNTFKDSITADVLLSPAEWVIVREGPFNFSTSDKHLVCKSDIISLDEGGLTIIPEPTDTIRIPMKLKK